jgi:voltage-gated sodium channel
LLTSRRWEQAIVSIIVINSLILGLETDPGIVAAFGPVLSMLDAAILAVFMIEILLRVCAFGPRFFPFQVLRALRILRALRLVSALPALRRVVGGLIAALPGMSSIVLLMAMLFYVAAVMATNLFGEAFPDWFGSLGASLYTLFQVMTLESWSMGIVRPVMVACCCSSPTCS